MSAREEEPESGWLLDGLGAAVLVLAAFAVGSIAALVWITVMVPV